MINDTEVQIVEHNRVDTDILCVLGCLRTERGLSICKELLKWISLRYHVYIVYQDYPGKLYEYPALKYAQELSIKYSKPVFYVHSKGAFNDNPSQLDVRALWWHIFFTRYDDCINALKHNDVICPFTGASKITWFNGFIATPAGWSNVKIQTETDRYIFESLWTHREITPTKVYGILSNNINHHTDVQRIMYGN